MWGWTGRNTPSSLAALRAPTVSDREHELKILERMALKIGNTGLRNPNMQNTPFNTVMMEQGLRELTRCIPWANNHVLHIPGAHEYLAGEYRKKKAFDTYISTFYAMGPQTMEKARMLGKDTKDDSKAGADASGLEAEWTSNAAQGDVKKKRMPMLNSDKYEEVKIPRLAQFDPSTIKLDGTVVAIGKRRTGKSFAYRHILHSLMEHFPAGICISQTDELNHYWRQYMPSKYIFNWFDLAILHAVFDRQKSIVNDARLTEEEREKKAPFFIILDDVISDTRIRYDPAIAELFVAGRHYKLFTMITTQYAKAITPTLRSNADYVLILHNKQEGQREALWRDFADFMTREAFYTLMDAYTEDNEILIVDTSDPTSKPWEVLKWFKADDPGPFLLGDEDYWASVTSSSAVPLATNALPIDSMQLRMPEMPTAE
ncbi:hypothetical protein T492DRAFT_892223 [Pavlovales sp. CCMP2436]|nr:hypothetical protein T492DRAFT_892223 [Pavlovales sp. CCMP2436]